MAMTAEKALERFHALAQHHSLAPTDIIRIKLARLVQECLVDRPPGFTFGWEIVKAEQRELLFRVFFEYNMLGLVIGQCKLGRRSQATFITAEKQVRRAFESISQAKGRGEAWMSEGGVYTPIKLALSDIFERIAPTNRRLSGRKRSLENAHAGSPRRKRRRKGQEEQSATQASTPSQSTENRRVRKVCPRTIPDWTRSLLSESEMSKENVNRTFMYTAELFHLMTQFRKDVDLTMTELTFLAEPAVVVTVHKHHLKDAVESERHLTRDNALASRIFLDKEIDSMAMFLERQARALDPTPSAAEPVELKGIHGWVQAVELDGFSKVVTNTEFEQLLLHIDQYGEGISASQRAARPDTGLGRNKKNVASAQTRKKKAAGSTLEVTQGVFMVQTHTACMHCAHDHHRPYNLLPSAIERTDLRSGFVPSPASLMKHLCGGDHHPSDKVYKVCMTDSLVERLQAMLGAYSERRGSEVARVFHDVCAWFKFVPVENVKEQLAELKVNKFEAFDPLSPDIAAKLSVRAQDAITDMLASMKNVFVPDLSGAEGRTPKTALWWLRRQQLANLARLIVLRSNKHRLELEQKPIPDKWQATLDKYAQYQMTSTTLKRLLEFDDTVHEEIAAAHKSKGLKGNAAQNWKKFPWRKVVAVFTLRTGQSLYTMDLRDRFENTESQKFMRRQLLPDGLAPRRITDDTSGRYSVARFNFNMARRKSRQSLLAIDTESMCALDEVTYNALLSAPRPRLVRKNVHGILCTADAQTQCCVCTNAQLAKSSRRSSARRRTRSAKRENRRRRRRITTRGAGSAQGSANRQNRRRRRIPTTRAEGSLRPRPRRRAAARSDLRRSVFPPARDRGAVGGARRERVSQSGLIPNCQLWRVWPELSLPSAGAGGASAGRAIRWSASMACTWRLMKEMRDRRSARMETTTTT